MGGEAFPGLPRGLGASASGPPPRYARTHLSRAESERMPIASITRGFGAPSSATILAARTFSSWEYCLYLGNRASSPSALQAYSHLCTTLLCNPSLDATALAPQPCSNSLVASSRSLVYFTEITPK